MKIVNRMLLAALLVAVPAQGQLRGILNELGLVGSEKVCDTALHLWGFLGKIKECNLLNHANFC